MNVDMLNALSLQLHRVTGAKERMRESLQTLHQAFPATKQHTSNERHNLNPFANTDGMRRPVSGRDAVYAPKLSTCSKHR
jgi:hypothetical protein